MDPKEFLLRHGEKIAVVLVAVLGAWAIYSALVNDGIRPEGTNAEKIKNDIESIAAARNAQQPPILKSAPDHVGDLKSRFGSDFAAQAAMVNTTQHPNAGNIRGEVSGHYYIYELNPPQVEVQDQVGVVEVRVSKPLSRESDDPRVSDKNEVSWEVEEKGEKIPNGAEIVGFILEQRTGVNANRPWEKIADLTLEQAANPFVVKNVAAFETYSFRATAVLRATGFLPGLGRGSEVLVHRGPYPKKPVDWDALNPAQSEVLKRFAAPAVGIAKVFPVEGEKDLLYVSKPSDDPADQIQAGIDLKIALKSVAAALPGAGAAPADGAEGGEPPANGADQGGAEARILVTKFHRQPNNAGVWVEPFLFKVKQGEDVGRKEDVVVPPAAQKIEVDFRTPFVLERIEQGRERIVFYEIGTKGRAGGGKDKDLELKPIPKQYDVAVLRNRQANTTIELIKLGVITRPARAIIYPDYPAGAFKEEEEFRKDPQVFRQVGMVPAEPIAHAPGEGPLKDLFDGGDQFAETDTTYYECADGRLVFWNHRNDVLSTLWKRGVTPKGGAPAADGDKPAAPDGGAPAPTPPKP
ncbi:MAG: hypothetical protein H0X45_00315 [Planctomycetes bacterium]|nr:hypothetical protein [Planctomycetota bacterium]